jgi:hypothetical protein
MVGVSVNIRRSPVIIAIYFSEVNTIRVTALQPMDIHFLDVVHFDAAMRALLGER